MDTKIFTKDNKYLMLALDHRGSFRRMINPEDPESVNWQQVIEMKQKIISPITDQMSGLLIDPVHGLPAYENAFKDKDKAPFLLCLEESGYDSQSDGRYTKLQYTTAEHKSLGAKGVKLLIYFNPFLEESAQHQLAISKQALADAHENDLPIFIEIVSYSSDQVKAKTPDLIFGALKMFLENGIRPDVFKLEYPGSVDDCKKITEIIGETPWILLTRGARFSLFQRQLQEAILGGAVGFLAGRALWQEALSISGEKQNDFLINELPRRFEQLSEIVLGK